MKTFIKAVNNPRLRLDITSYIVIAMAISALLALLLGAVEVSVIALIIIACAEAIEIPNTPKKRQKFKENKDYDRPNVF